jgi:hypothetical protein
LDPTERPNDRARRGRARHDDAVKLQPEQLRHKRGKQICFAFGKAPLDNEVLPFHIAKLAQSLGNASSLGCIPGADAR